MHPSYLRQYHASQIFHALRALPGISQKDLADITGCDKSTVSLIIKRFEEIGLVERSTQVSPGRRGRPSEVLKISALGGLLIGVHVQKDHLQFVAANVDGRPFAMKSLPLPDDPADLADHVRDGMAVLCGETKRDVGEIRAVGITLPGLVGSGAALAEFHYLPWKKAAVPKLLKSKIGPPVYVDNDTNAATMAEYLFGECSKYTDFIMLDAGIGVGGGVFIDGRLYRGKSGFGGELGHVKVVKDGRICGCGSTGCLAAYVSTTSLLTSARRTTEVHSVDEFMAAADAGDPNIRYVLQEAGEILGIAMSTLVNVFNPPAIVLGGIFARLWPYLREGTRRTLNQGAMKASLEDVEIVISKISNDDVPWGAVALALEGFSSLSPGETMPW